MTCGSRSWAPALPCQMVGASLSPWNRAVRGPHSKVMGSPHLPVPTWSPELPGLKGRLFAGQSLLTLSVLLGPFTCLLTETRFQPRCVQTWVGTQLGAMEDRTMKFYPPSFYRKEKGLVHDPCEQKCLWGNSHKKGASQCTECP